MHCKLWAIRHGKCRITAADRLWVKYGSKGPPRGYRPGKNTAIALALMASMLGLNTFGERD
jgi:hypothetical protein